MRYLWEAVLAAQDRLREADMRFSHMPGSAYMELSLPYMNQDLPDDAQDGAGETVIGVNTYYRFYSIFKDMLLPDLEEFPALRDSLANLILHMLAWNDILSGMTKDDFHRRMLAGEVLEGGFGETAREVFLDMAREEREVLLGGWLRSFRVGSALPIFLDMVHGLVADSIVYCSNEDREEILLYTPLKKERKLERRITFLVDTFLDIKYHVEIFYEHHFGIIGIEETMRIGETAVC